MSYLERLRSALLEDEVGPAVPLLSSEGLKSVFDIVRNYSLCVLVMLGSFQFAQLSSSMFWNQPPEAMLSAVTVVRWFLYCMTVLLFVGNAFFTTYVFERTPFYRDRTAKLTWAVLSVIISLVVSAIVCLPLYVQYGLRQ